MYIVYYVVLDPHRIHNRLEPDRDTLYREERDRKFFSRLEASVLAEGFLSPILVYNDSQGLWCKYGGSRLYFAKKHNMHIPCFVTDWKGNFEGEEECTTMEDIVAKMHAHPEKIQFTDRGLIIKGLPHTHLKKR